MLPFIRSDLAQLTAYSAHALEPNLQIDRLDTNESPFDLPAELRQKLGWTFQTLIESNRYPDGTHHALKEAIAAYVTETAPGLAAPLTPDHLSIGNGSDELIRSLLIATCVGGEGSVLVAEPTFSMYRILARTLGIPVVTIERTANFELDAAAAQQAIATCQAPPVRVVFMVHPNSPTGNLLTATELDWLRRLPTQVLVVIDEAYFEFSQSTLVPELAHRPNWVVLRTFSKAFRLAAHRMGYAIAHPELAAALEKVRLPYNLPSFSQVAALTALTHRDQLLATTPELLHQRTLMQQALAQHPALQVWPSAGNFLFVQLQPSASTAPAAVLSALFANLKAQGSLIRLTCGGLRLTIGTPDENARLLARLQAALDPCLAAALPTRR